MVNGTNLSSVANDDSNLIAIAVGRSTVNARRN